MGNGAAGVTIYDVAHAAGVSIKTVSRVINGAPNVRPGTAAAVQRAIDDLGYRPNAAARSLAAGRNDTIGVIVDRLQDPFFGQIVAVAEARALELGMDVLVASTGVEGHRATAHLARLVQRGVAGMLIAPFGDDDPIWREIPRDRPVVLIDRRCGVQGLDVVRADDEQAAKAAVEHLITHGHKRIAFMGAPMRFSTVSDRLDGYLAALAAHGIPADPTIIETQCADATDSTQLLRPRLDAAAPPTAVFSSTPMIAEGVVRALALAGRRDVAHVAFGDFPLADVTSPPTTVIDQCPETLAHAAMDRLLARISGTELAPEDIVLPTRLIPRGSGELLPPPDAPQTRNDMKRTKVTAMEVRQ